jgi:hypothetical protein
MIGSSTKLRKLELVVRPHITGAHILYDASSAPRLCMIVPVLKKLLKRQLQLSTQNRSKSVGLSDLLTILKQIDA